MNTVLIVGEDKELWHRASAHTQMISWAGFQGHLQDWGWNGVAVLNLTDPAALTLPEATRLLERHSEMRVLFVTDTLAKLPAATRRRLIRPGVDILTRHADRAEFKYRLQRLLDLPSVPQSAPASPLEPLRGLLPDLHDPRSGRLDAQRLAERFGLPLTVLSRALGQRYGTVHRTPASPALQDGLRVYLRIAAALHRLTGSDAAGRVWLNAPNPDLLNETPHTLMGRSLSDAEVVAELLEDSLLGLPG